MAQAQPQQGGLEYKLDYKPAQGVIITDPHTGVEKVFPVHPVPADSPFTLFQYNPVSPHLRIPPQTIENFTDTQKFIRIWDMIKDGSSTQKMNGDIWSIMNQGQSQPYDHFSEIRKEIVKLPNISAKIVKSTWIKPNIYETEHAKLNQRHTYQESGISPDAIIENPDYVVNIGNTVIDPFKRNFQGQQNINFPGAGNHITITPAFFTFMGFSD